MQGREPQQKQYHFLKPHLGKRLTQGAIFTCARAERYGGCEVHGLVLTARCDLTQNKAPVTNYVPVVRLDDWLHRDFLEILLDRCDSDLLERFQNFLKRQNLAQSLLIAHSPRTIIESHFPETGANRDQQTARRKGMEIVERIESLAAVRALPAARKPVLELARDFDGIRSRLMKDCVHQKLSGYYFLPSVAIGGDSRGYIALLREVYHLPSAVARLVAEGLDASTCGGLISAVPQIAGLLSVAPDEMAYVVSVLQSPYVEHLLQVFGMLFGRIGLPDPEENYVSGLWLEQPSVKGGAQ